MPLAIPHKAFSNKMLPHSGHKLCTCLFFVLFRGMPITPKRPEMIRHIRRHGRSGRTKNSIGPATERAMWSNQIVAGHFYLAPSESAVRPLKMSNPCGYNYFLTHLRSFFGAYISLSAILSHKIFIDVHSSVKELLI